jgi:hypothetical protein
MYIKVKQSLYRPLAFQEFEASEFQNNWHVKMVRLSDLSAGRVYSPGNILYTHFC